MYLKKRKSLKDFLVVPGGPNQKKEKIKTEL
jgi:hypothetical protein